MALFDFFRRRRPREDGDPLAAFDRYIEALDRQGAEVRRSAATLLALRGELARSAERYRRRLDEVAERIAVAGERSDEGARQALERDRLQARQLLTSTEESIARAEADGQLLMDTARELSEQLTELQAERVSARARLASGQVVTDALRERGERIGRSLALDAARDEVERAHQLAELYREERRSRG